MHSSAADAVYYGYGIVIHFQNDDKTPVQSVEVDGATQGVEGKEISQGVLTVLCTAPEKSTKNWQRYTILENGTKVSGITPSSTLNTFLAVFMPQKKQLQKKPQKTAIFGYFLEF